MKKLCSATLAGVLPRHDILAIPTPSHTLIPRGLETPAAGGDLRIAATRETVAGCVQRLHTLPRLTAVSRVANDATFSMGPMKRMRAVASKGGRLSTPEPDTSRVVALLSDHGQRLRMHFLNDGRIDAHEAALLDGVEDATFWAEEADDGRLAAIALLNINKLSPWQQRKWRERHRDHTPKSAA